MPFQKAYDNFSASLTNEERDKFRFATLGDLRHTLHTIQKKHADKRETMNLGRVSAFLEGMGQMEKVIKVFRQHVVLRGVCLGE
jgi:hypothetical protein